MKKELAANLNNSLVSRFIHSLVEGNVEGEGHGEHMVYNHLHLRVVEQIDCGYDEEPPSYEERSQVRMDSLVWGVNVFTTVERADRIDGCFVFQLLMLPFEHTIGDYHGEVKNDTDRNCDCNICCGGRL